MTTKLNSLVDHTNLKPFATQEDIRRLCSEAKEYQFASVCVHPCHVALAKEQLAGSPVKVCTVIGFPLGANTTAVKTAEVLDAKNNGCDEFDMVLNIGALKDGRLDVVEEDIRSVVKAAGGRCVKVILETGLLTEEEKVTATRPSCRAGASFVKTCTGFSNGAATAQDVALMKASCTGSVRVKASAGIRSYADAVKLVEAGAQRLGTSSGIQIVQEQPID